MLDREWNNKIENKSFFGNGQSANINNEPAQVKRIERPITVAIGKVRKCRQYKKAYKLTSMAIDTIQSDDYTLVTYVEICHYYRSRFPFSPFFS